ncbi:DUF167 domain-containing protein [Mycolicibacter kumamotonensis]|uniref:UPF0235 protein BST28_04705 n=1 Tax=Mycolicibacter kumamotonensis TaxID=354243 RepID=A0A1X0ECI3_9MYCO|nr:DUF167 domain-containing protein [Mycolicibacter kumamotonensis]NDJ88891.1 DUF167 domain-containing protein [Mycolicibacter kumamotonensis]ORA82289.1 hypothetical protein BST28_04705 [Mycolicibacter kumamotonensis]
MSSTETVVVKVKPGSRKGPLVEADDDGQLTVYVREQAVDGKANAAVIRVLAEHFGVPRSRVELASGAGARIKRFRIDR